MAKTIEPGRGSAKAPRARLKPAVVPFPPLDRRRRRLWVPVANLTRLVLWEAFRSWLHNLRTLAPAIGSIALLIFLIGAIAVGGLVANKALQYEAAQASVLHVYLADDTSSDQATELRQTLAKQPNVQWVVYLTKEQSLARAKQRPGLAELADVAGSNPFPATLEVQVDQPLHVGPVAAVAGSLAGVDAGRPTSYDERTYERLKLMILVAGAILGGFALLMGFVTYAVSSNAFRGYVLARRQELTTMQLVGASPLLIRARLVIEGGLTGGIAGVLAGGALAGVCVLALYAERRLLVTLLPGVTSTMVTAAAAAAVAVAFWIGSVSSLFSFRRLRL